MLLLTIRPDVDVPIDEKTGKPVDYVEARVNALLDTLEKQKTKIIIPTPVLSEVLVDAGKDIVSLLQIIQKNSAFEIKPFDTLAAAELAAITYNAKLSGDKKSGSKETWAKIKFDRQIVAIAKVHKATAIYSDDQGLAKFAKKANIDVITLADLPFPDRARQTSFLKKENDNKVILPKLERDINLDFEKEEKSNDGQDKETE